MTEFKLKIDTSDAKKAAAAAADVDKLAESLEHTANAAVKFDKNGRARDRYGRFLADQNKLFSTSKNGAIQRSFAASTVQSYRLSSGIERVRRGVASVALSMGATGGTLKAINSMAIRSDIAFGKLRKTGAAFAESIQRVTSNSVVRGMARITGQGLGAAAGATGRGVAALGMGAVGAVATGGAALAGGAVLAGGFIAKNMFEATKEAERLKYALDAITEGRGKEWWATSSEYARRFGFDVNGVADQLMNLKASGFTDEMAKTLFLSMGDLRSIGATEETIGRALLAIRQIHAIGRLQGEELNQLSEAGVNANFVYDQLAKTLGKTVPQIIKMKEKGKLSADIVIPAIIGAIGTKTKSATPGAAGEAAASKTLSGMLGRLSGAFGIAQIEGLGTESLEPLKTGISALITWIEGDGGKRMFAAVGRIVGGAIERIPAAIEWMVNFFDVTLPNALETVSDMWTQFKASFALNGTTAAAWEGVFESISGVGSVSGVLIEIAGALGSIAGGIATVVGYFVQFEGLMIGIANQISELPWWEMILTGVLGLARGPIGVAMSYLGIEMMNTLATAVRTMAGAVADAFLAVVRQAIAGVASVIASMPIIGRFLPEGFAQGITGGSNDVFAAGGGLGEAAMGGTAYTTDSHSPSREMDYLGQDQGWGFSDGMDKSIGWVEQSGKAMGSAAVQSASVGAAINSASVSSGGGSFGGGGGGITINLGGISVSGGSTPAETGAAIGQATRRALEAELAPIFRQLSYQGT
jgi:tape measure domain-containing protein